MSIRPPLVAWASRGAGGVGMVTALIYLAIILGEDDPSQLPVAILFFIVMAAAGVGAWFADRMTVVNGRRVMWLAFAVYFVLGVLAVFSVGLLFLIAAVLSIFSLSRGSGKRKPVPSPDGGDDGR